MNLWSVQPPNFGVQDILDAWIIERNNGIGAGAKYGSRRDILIGLKGVILTNEGRLLSAIRNSVAFKFERKCCEKLPGLSQEDLFETYIEYLGGARARQVNYRNRILKESNNGFCVYCNESGADTLDHVIPKSRVPELVFTPVNLVAACSHCNQRLSSSYGGNVKDARIHVYEQLDYGRWLYCDVVFEDAIPSYRFRAVPNCGNLGLDERVCNAFECLGLSDWYAQQAVRRVGDFRGQIELLKNDPKVASYVSAARMLAREESVRMGENYLPAVILEGLAEAGEDAIKNCLGL